MHYTTERAKFRTFSQTDQNVRTKLKFQDSCEISRISGQFQDSCEISRISGQLHGTPELDMTVLTGVMYKMMRWRDEEKRTKKGSLKSAASPHLDVLMPRFRSCLDLNAIWPLSYVTIHNLYPFIFYMCLLFKTFETKLHAYKTAFLDTS